MSKEQLTTYNSAILRETILQLLQDGKTSEMVDWILSIFEKLQNQVESQAQFIQWLQKKPFRPSSEVIEYLQGSLFDLPAESPPEPPVPPATKPPRTRSPRSQGRTAFPDTLPRKETIIEVPESDRTCPHCQAEKAVIGYETSEILNYIPGHFEVDVLKREKRACRACEEGVVVAPVAHKLIEKGVPGVGLMTEILISKYRDHLPLYRLEERFARMGVTLSRSSMSTWVQVVTEDLLQPIVDRIREKALEAYLLQSDDTTLRVLDRTHPKNIILGYLWFYVGDGRYAFVDFRKSRNRDGPIEVVKSRKSGYLQTDGYSGYERLYNGKEATLTHVGCWMHARRYFHDAYQLKDTRALIVLEWIRDLYQIEESVTGDAIARQEIRQSQSRLILDKMEQWANDTVLKIPPSTHLGKAIQYLRNQWTSLILFVNDGRLPLDNGAVERAIRPVAVGRKNYLFAGSPRGARNAASLYSILATCALNDIQPDRYLNDVLDKLMRDWPAKAIDDLLPDRWKTLFDPDQTPLHAAHSR